MATNSNPYECYSNRVTLLKRLGKADTVHDFADIERLIKILESWGDKTTARAMTDNIIRRVNESIGYIPNCGTDNDNENKLLQFFYGTEQPYIPFDPFVQQLPISNNYAPASNTGHKTYMIPFNYISNWFDYIKTFVFPNQQYILDHTVLSPFFCEYLKGDNPPIIETIAKAYDRSSEMSSSITGRVIDSSISDDRCSIIRIHPSIPSIPVLKKEDGELFLFDEIYILNESTLGWKYKNITGEILTGEINIERMADASRSDLPENLSAMIMTIATSYMNEEQLTQLTERIDDLNTFIQYAYGIHRHMFSDDRLFILALTDLKRMGDLLQVKLAELFKAKFVSNDRMAVLIASVGYQIGCMRTTTSRPSTLGTDDRSNRLVSLYNVQTDPKILEEAMIRYEKDEIVKYKSTIDIFNYINSKIVLSKDTSPKLIAKYNLYSQSLQGQTPYISSTMTVINPSTGRPIRNITPNHINYDYLINRSICIICYYITFLYLTCQHIYYISALGTMPIIDEHTTSSISIKKDFNENMLPHPNTLLMNVSSTQEIDESMNHLYNMIYQIINILPDISDDFNTRKEWLVSFIHFVKEKNMSLFGTHFTMYLKDIEKILLVKRTGYVVNIGDNYYVVGMTKGFSTIIDHIKNFEDYVESLCKIYPKYCVQQGGKNKKVKTKRGGNSNNKYTIQEYPSDLIEYMLTRLIEDIYKRPDVSEELFLLYMQLQLITQQFNINLIIFNKASDEEIKTLPYISKVAEQSKGFINKITRQLYSPKTMTQVAPAAEGGKKKVNAKTKKSTKMNKKK